MVIAESELPDDEYSSVEGCYSRKQQSFQNEINRAAPHPIHNAKR